MVEEERQCGFISMSEKVVHDFWVSRITGEKICRECGTELRIRMFFNHMWEECCPNCE